MPMSLVECRKLLGVEEHATLNAVNSAFRKKSLSVHPDKFPAEQKAEMEAKFKQLSNARDTLAANAFAVEKKDVWCTPNKNGAWTDAAREAAAREEARRRAAAQESLEQREAEAQAKRKVAAQKATERLAAEQEAARERFAREDAELKAAAQEAAQRRAQAQQAAAQQFAEQHAKRKAAILRAAERVTPKAKVDEEQRMDRVEEMFRKAVLNERVAPRPMPAQGQGRLQEAAKALDATGAEARARRDAQIGDDGSAKALREQKIRERRQQEAEASKAGRA